MEEKQEKRGGKRENAGRRKKEGKKILLLLELDKYEQDYADDLKNDIDILKSAGLVIELNKINNAYLEEHCKKMMEEDAIAKLSKA